MMNKEHNSQSPESSRGRRELEDGRGKQPTASPGPVQGENQAADAAVWYLKGLSHEIRGCSKLNQ